jgi:HEAT repeat protein
LEKDAERLAADASTRGLVGRLIAATLMSQALTHREARSPEGIPLLQRLAVDPEPTVAAVALTRLLDIDPELLVPVVERLLASPDPNVRSFGVEILSRRPSEKHIHLLGNRLDDLHPDVRVKARKSLQTLAGKDEFKNLVIIEGTRMLASGQWRGLEQAVILLANLDHKPAAARFLELLQFERPEVFVTAAWGLRKLAVPDTLPPVTSYVKEELERIHKGVRLPNRPDVPPEIIDHQVSQLNQFLGQQRYGPAEALLRRFVPHEAPLFPCPESRAAAVWGLGMILEGKTDAKLAEDLEVRLRDTNSIPPENVQVRRMAALTIGRLKAEGPLPRLRLYCAEQKPNDDAVHNACGWAIERITGEPMLWSLTIEKVQRDWFLTPSE